MRHAFFLLLFVFYLVYSPAMPLDAPDCDNGACALPPTEQTPPPSSENFAH